MLENVKDIINSESEKKRKFNTVYKLLQVLATLRKLLSQFASLVSRRFSIRFLFAKLVANQCN